MEGWLRHNQILEPVARMEGFVSPRLGIRFEPGEGSDKLTILDPDVNPFLTAIERVEQADEQRVRADRLAAKLRQLGIEPE